MSERDEERDPGVLGGLSRTRPQRRSGRRPAGTAAASSTAAKPARAKAEATAKPAAKHGKARAKPATKPAKASAKPRTRSKPRAGSAPKAKTKPPSRAKPKAVPALADAAPANKRGTIRQPSQPRNVPKQPEPRSPLEPEETHGPSPVVTAAQAAGELAQIGLTVGTQAIKGVLSRLPRP